jgi:hypothetical protein
VRPGGPETATDSFADKPRNVWKSPIGDPRVYHVKVCAIQADDESLHDVVSITGSGPGTAKLAET